MAIRKQEKSNATPSARLPLRLRWGKFEPMVDYWGKVIPRFYQLETLANAIEALLGKNDRFIVPSIHEILGPSPVVSLNVELFQEGAYQLVFRIKAINQKRHQAQFALVVAKQAGKISQIAEREHNYLVYLHRRAPDYVVKPFYGGIIFLPDRHGRPEKGRKIYAYMTQWLSGYHELGIDKTLQFFINTKTPHLFSKAQTEELKTQMIEIISRLYDPNREISIELPQIASGDFVVSASRGGPLKLKLIACRRLVHKISPDKLIDMLLHAKWKWGNQTFYLVPEQPQDFFEGLAKGVGTDLAKTWVRLFAEKMQGEEKQRSPYAAALIALVH